MLPYCRSNGAAKERTSPTARRLLFLLPFAPRLDATHGGGRVTAHLLANLARQHRVGLVYLRAPNEPSVDNVLQKQCELVEEVTRPEIDFSVTQRWSRCTSLLQGKPLGATGLTVSAYGTRVRALARTWQPDIVQIEFHVMGQYLSALDNCPAPRVLIEHEPGVKAARELWQRSPPLARVVSYLDLLAWRRYERTIIKQVQAIVAFTESDLQEMSQLAGEIPVVRIPVGTVLPEYPLNPRGLPPLSLLFVGNFIHPPNADAAVRLIKVIFPRVQARFPKSVLYIVGDQLPLHIRQMANNHIIVTGQVPDVAPFLDRAALVVVPLRLGGGMRVKVLEALAAGKAVVASPLAIEGLDLTDGEQVRIAESGQQFCEVITELLTDPGKRAALATRARSWACAHLGWEKSIAAYETLYEHLIRHSRIRQRPWPS